MPPELHPVTNTNEIIVAPKQRHEVKRFRRVPEERSRFPRRTNGNAKQKETASPASCRSNGALSVAVDDCCVAIVTVTFWDVLDTKLTDAGVKAQLAY